MRLNVKAARFPGYAAPDGDWRKSEGAAEVTRLTLAEGNVGQLEPPTPKMRFKRNARPALSPRRGGPRRNWAKEGFSNPDFEWDFSPPLEGLATKGGSLNGLLVSGKWFPSY